jgi:ATP/ADP translocase
MIERLRKEFFDIRPGEWPLALGLSTYFFLVIAIFWVLKPIKRGLVISYFGDNPIHLAGWVLSGAQAEQLGKVLNMVVAFAVVGLFTWLVRRYARHHLIVIFCGIFGALFLLFGSVITQIEALGDTAVWSFYVTGDIWTTVMVATFWAFANDLNTGDEAERLYGIVGLGGVVGGFVGATVVSGLVEQAGRSTLVFACILPTALIGALAVWIHRRECGKVRGRPQGALLSRRRGRARGGAGKRFSGRGQARGAVQVPAQHCRRAGALRDGLQHRRLSAGRPRRAADYGRGRARCVLWPRGAGHQPRVDRGAAVF